MGKIKFITTIMYWAVNYILAAFAYSWVMNDLKEILSFKIPVILIAIGLVLLDKILTPKLGMLQFLLTALVIILNAGQQNTATTIAAQVALITVVALKFYSIKLAYNWIRGNHPNQTETLALATDSSKFYSSQAWRKLRYKIIIEQGKKCAHCGTTDPNTEYHVDHIRPRSKFPQYALDPKNLRVCCKACNLGRSNHWTLNDKGEEIPCK